MLYIMRHGITDWNKLQKLQGRTDVPLNDEGRALAEIAAEEYADVHFDICFCSPLKRARETAEIFLKDRDIPIILDDRLKEMGFGIFEGTTNYFHDKSLAINVFFENPDKYIIPVEGGESLDDLFSRTGEFLSEVIEPLLEQGKDIVIVGHGAMNSSIVCQRLNLPRSEFWSKGIKNCKLMEI